MRATALQLAFGFLLCAAAAGVAPGAASAATVFTAVLDGAQEAPGPGHATATGSATLILNDTQDRLTMSIQINGLDLGGQTTTTTDDVIAAHIHAGAVGVPGGVVWGFIGMPFNDNNPNDVVVDAVAGTVSAAWDAAEGNGTTLTAQLANLFADGLYLNFHTNGFTAGAIRGQIIAAVPEPGALALLAGGLAVFVWRRRPGR